VSAPVALHMAKVSGISGAEAHLLSLLPLLRRRGWDVRFLMLHENEPGAWRFARSLEAGGVPLDAIPVRADVDPLAFLRLVAYLRRVRPTIVHTHLVHADAYGQLAGLVARVPVRLSTKHGFNEFREERLFALGDRLVGRPRRGRSRSRAASRATSPRRRASPSEASRSSTTGSRPPASRRPIRTGRSGSSASAG
jgi:hypothetical protein